MICGCTEADRAFQSTLSVRRATRPGKGKRSKKTIFQSTLSVRRATKISIHALREESDSHKPLNKLPIGYFNPRSP